jgi:hypothetical protein
MEISGDLLALVFIIIFIILLIIGIIYAIATKRTGSSSINSVTFYGATSEFLDADKKAAVEHVLDVQADKKMEEEESGDPDKK